MAIQAKYTGSKGLVQTLKKGFASATIDITTDIVLTSTVQGEARNKKTFQLVTNAVAANPTDTVLAVFSGTADAVVLTLTPNDGTNNNANGNAAVNITSAQVAELINTGAVAGLNVTLTDDDRLRRLQTASGGDPAQNMVNGGGNAGGTATFLGAPEAEFHVAGEGVSSDLQTNAHQVVKLTTVADSATLFQSTIKISTPTDTFSLFFNREAPDNVAVPAGSTNVELSAGGGDDEDAVATALNTAIDALGAAGAAFDTSLANGNEITVKANVIGVAASPDMGTSGITSEIVSAGSGSTVLNTTGVTIINTTHGEAGAMSLGDLTATQAGTLKTIQRIDNSGAALTVSVSKHAAGNPTTLTFDAQNEFACLIWLGDKWANIGKTLGV